MIQRKRISYRVEPKAEISHRLPILRGFVIGRSIVVHCPFCDKFNVHGWDPRLTERDIYYSGAHRDFKNHLFSEGPGVLYRVGPFRKRDLKAIKERQKEAGRRAKLRAWRVKQNSDDAKKEEESK
jgi:hypothetical protein